MTPDPVPLSLHEVFKNASVFIGFALLIVVSAVAVISVHLVFVTWPSVERVSLTELRGRVDKLEAVSEERTDDPR